MFGRNMISAGMAFTLTDMFNVEALQSIRWANSGQPHALGKGVRTSTSKYMPHHGKNVSYYTNDKGHMTRVHTKVA